MLIQIKHRFNGSVLFWHDCEENSLKITLLMAIKAGSDLRGANLSGANLRGANLSGANLRGINLSSSDLRYSDLRYSDLRGANLRGANLSGANLSGSNLRYSDLSSSDLSGSDLRGANLSDSIMPEIAPAELQIERLDKVRAIILDDVKRLEMDHWHGSTEWIDKTCAEEAVCGTTHCLAGWLQVCSTDPEIRKLDTQFAGAIQAPVANKMFFKDSEKVLNWLENRSYVEELDLVQRLNRAEINK